MTLSVAVVMRAFWLDPYLWIHLAGLAMVPLSLEVCLLGLAVGDPVLPVWLEFLLLIGVGIGPVLWMQLRRPFYIFAAIAVALQPGQLTEDQRRLLTLIKLPRHRIVAMAAAVGLVPVAWQLYCGAAIAAPMAPFDPASRWLGLLVASLSLLAAHLFLQVPLNVLGVLWHRQAEFAATAPYPLDAIASDFTILGVQMRQLLPPITPSPVPVVETAAAAAGLSSTWDLSDDPWGIQPESAIGSSDPIESLAAETVLPPSEPLPEPNPESSDDLVE